MPAPIALLTDFGLEDTYVGVMKGVIAGIAPDVPVIDITHAVPPGDIRHGAFKLWQAARYFPQGSVFTVVVDPGVGTARRPVAVAWHGRTFVLPDNGLMTYLLASAPAEAAVALENPEFRLPYVSSTFHGRDLFAPAAAHLARGVPLARFGPLVEDLARFDPPRLEVLQGAVRGEVVHVDRFGNLITSIGFLEQREEALSLRPWLPGPAGTELPLAFLRVRLPSGRRLPLHRTFGDVPEGRPVAYVGSERLLEIAINRGRASDRLEMGRGAEVWLEATEPS